MKGRVISQITPQQKAVAVNNRFGNTNIKGQQGTTRVIYDSLPLDGSTELRFFENAASRQYPFTNIGSEGNRLTVGETFVIQKIYFGLIEIDPDTGSFIDFTQLTGTGANFETGEFSFLLANSQVIKQLPFSVFCASGQTVINPANISDQTFDTFTDIVIPPLLEYVLTYRIAPYTAVATNRLVCFMEGTAGIIAPQTTF
jgi:hypothetical protein